MAKDDWLSDYAKKQGWDDAAPAEQENDINGAAGDEHDTLADLPNGGSIIQGSGPNETAHLVERPQAYENTKNVTDRANDEMLYKKYLAQTDQPTPDQLAPEPNVPTGPMGVGTQQTPEWLDQAAKLYGYDKPVEQRQEPSTVEQLDKALTKEQPKNVKERAGAEVADAEKDARYLENARRIQSGQPTIEEENITNARRIQKGLPTTHEVKRKRYEENAKRIQAGKPTLEEEERHTGGGGAQANWFGDLLRKGSDKIEEGANKFGDWAAEKMGLAENEEPQTVAGGMAGGMGALLPLPNIANMVAAQGNMGVAPATQTPKPQVTIDDPWRAKLADQSASNQPHVEGMGTQQGLSNALTAQPNVTPNNQPPPPEANAGHFADTGAGGAGGAGVGGGAPAAPLHVPAQHLVGGGWANRFSPEAQAGRKHLEGETGEAVEQNTIDARLANEMYRQFYAKRTAELQAEQAQQLAAKQQAQLVKEKAQDTYEAAQKEAKEAKVDPDKVFGGTWGRIFAGLAAGLGAVGQGLTHSHTNSALDLIKSRVQESMDAQKSALNEKTKVADNAYARLLAVTGDEKSADSAFKQAGYAVAESQAQELGASAKDSELMMGLRKARTDELADHVNYLQSAQGRVPVGIAGGLPKEVKDAAEKIRLDPNFKGTDEEAIATAARLKGYDFGGGRGEFEDRASTAANKNTITRHSIASQIEHKRMLGRQQSALSIINNLRSHLEGGMEWGGGDSASAQKELLAQDVGFIFHGGASGSAAEGLLKSLGDMNPTSLTQWATGHPGKKALDRIEQLIREKQSQEIKAGASVASGEGFGGLSSPDEDAAKNSATEE